MSQYTFNSYYNYRHSVTFRYGRYFNGRTYRNWIYRRGWNGWTKKFRSRKLNRWVYWSPGACWYVFNQEFFIPCDHLTDENYYD